MSEQQVISITGVSMGLVAALFLCVGGASMSATSITKLSKMRWDFNQDVARSLAAQRAQYATGALLLLGSFVLQATGLFASPTNLVTLPQCFQTWHALALSVMTAAGAVGLVLCTIIYMTTISKMLRLLNEGIE